jgi:hypothetical protein
VAFVHAVAARFAITAMTEAFRQRLRKADLHVAKEQLASAEASFESRSDAQETKDLACRGQRVARGARRQPARRNRGAALRKPMSDALSSS